MPRVYRHRRLDNFEIFYIGISKGIKRPYSKHGRNKYWKHIITKIPYSVEIIQECDTWEDACELEILLINEYGRKDLGTGSLCNMTEGGDGNKGLIRSSKEKNRLKTLRLGSTFTQDHIMKLSKPVSQFDLQGNHIKDYMSAYRVRNELGILHVNEVCRNKRKTAGGYIWKYKQL